MTIMVVGRPGGRPGLRARVGVDPQRDDGAKECRRTLEPVVLGPDRSGDIARTALALALNGAWKWSPLRNALAGSGPHGPT
ncbi:hypothetical protein ABZ826_02370 [Streptomyces sp. NPDC047515]|uniref:hypothetical protein n=1 Tax=Streptomyces sp. NPDC047515 TaxID=3155380 RepID=UPI0033C231ED